MPAAGPPSPTSATRRILNYPDYGYAGYRFDDATQLYYTRNRYDDPYLGRFLSPDPIGLAGGINFYAYAGNDPINGVDPSGLSSECIMNGGGGNADPNTLTQTLGDPTGNGAATSPELTQANVTARLQGYTNQAAEAVDSEGLAALTPAQAVAAMLNPNLYPMFRGTAIDSLTRQLVAQDPQLSGRLIGQPNKGPDFIDQLTGAKYDMTTPGAFPSHQARPGYGEDLIHLNTGTAQPLEIPEVPIE